MKLREVYLAENVSDSHRTFVWEKVDALTKGKKGSRTELFDLLRMVYSHYDNGGHSCGRSQRSRLLESCMEVLQKRKLLRRDEKEVSRIITILVSMYHDDNYIIRMGWYQDIDLKYGLISEIQERVHLMAVFELLRLKELTDERPE